MTTWYSTDGPLGGVPADDRGLQYGDGLFETIAIRNGTARLLRNHLARLADGCRRLQLPYPGDSVVEDLVEHVLRSNDQPVRGIVKLVLTAGEGPRGYARPVRPTPRLIGRFSPNDGIAASRYDTGVAAAWSDITASIQPALAGIKSLNRLDQVLARQAIGEEFEHLLCDIESRIICGTMSNIMLVIEQQLVTPDLARAGVAGVMRSAVLEAVDDVVVRDVYASEAETATEILLCNSQFGILPVASLGYLQFEGRSVYGQVRDALAAAGVVEP